MMFYTPAERCARLILKFLRIIKNILKIFLLFIVILYFLGIDIKDVFAASQIDWGYEKELPLKAFFYGSNGAEITGGFVSNTNYMQSSNDLTNAYIRIITNTGEQFKKDYLYNIQFYFCTSRDPGSFAGYTFRFKTTYNDVSSTNNYSWSSTNIFTLSSPFANGVSGDTKVDRMNYCYYTTSLSVPSQNLNYVEMGITTSARLGYFSLIGVEVQELGVFTEALKVIVETAITTSNTSLKADVIDNANQNKQEIIDNQNSNTQQQISNANSNSQAEIDNANKNHEDMKNTITDDSNIDVDTSELGNLTGLLPAGPLDSLLNIPFYYTGKIVNSFGGSCKPIEVPVLGGEKWTFTCLGDQMYSKIFDSYMMKFIELVPCAFILIVWFKNLYKRVDRATGMQTNADDEWGVI